MAATTGLVEQTQDPVIGKLPLIGSVEQRSDKPSKGSGVKCHLSW